MCEAAVHTVNMKKGFKLTINAYDPTKTLTLRNAFVADLNRRFNSIKKDIVEAIVTDDVFDLNQPKVVTFASPGYKAFQFGTSSQKVDEFMLWFTGQVDKKILETTLLQQIGTPINQAWTNIYIADSYKRGVIRARYELTKAQFGTPSIADTGGIGISMSTPFHIDRLGVLYSRTFQELKGITAAMDTQISRVLSQGIADGDGPRLLANKLVNVIDGKGSKVSKLAIKDSLGRFIPAQRRAEIMARTEIIRAHHQATMQEYENWGAEKVHVKAEWATAGDERVCAICQSFEGHKFPLAEIRNMIPQHPLCRCIALPVKIESNDIL